MYPQGDHSSRLHVCVWADAVKDRLIGVVAAVVILVLGLVIVTSIAHSIEMPRAALQYQAQLTREARYAFGMDGPIAMLGGQIHQESGYDPNAKSAFASGLAQFTPGTAAWIAGLYKDLGPASPLDPTWALRALVTYDKRLYDSAPFAKDDCNRWAYVLSSYNGGLGNLQRDIGICKASIIGTLPCSSDGSKNFPRFAAGFGSYSSAEGVANLSFRFGAVSFPPKMVVRSEAPMLPVMLAMGHDRQVLRAKIGSVSVAMMNKKFSRQLVTQNALSNPTMNIDNTSVLSERRVAVQQENGAVWTYSSFGEKRPQVSGKVLNQHVSQTVCNKCDPSQWWGNVELFSARSKAAMVENRGYPLRILYMLQPVYAAWGTKRVC